jgi:thiosulfate/3-mercaptopyruvate sulfurtransferase
VLFRSENSSNVVILDVRTSLDYGSGHISGSINSPLISDFAGPCTGPISGWITGSSECVWMELPSKEDLFKTIGDLGLTKQSIIVLVTASNPGEPPHYGLTWATRVADSLIYAGIRNVAILDGGFPKWAAEGKPTTTDVPIVRPATYHSEVNRGMFASIDYVRRNIHRAVIIDGRDPDIYFGITFDNFLPMGAGLGHIPEARSLPAPWKWEQQTVNGTDYYLYKDKKILEAMAAGVIGHRDEEIIVYCSVGGYASSWWFVLTQVLGYKNVKLYDGSAQEWALKGYPFVPYQWE